MKKSRVQIQLARTLIAAASMAFLVGSTSWAQISVGDSGVGPLTFDTLPTPTEGWSTLSIAGGAGDITDAGTMDGQVIANTDATAVTTQLGSSSTQPPSQNAIARWNSALHLLQTRPTGNNYNLLMATLQNNGTVDRTTIIISYDFSQKNSIPVNESVPGHRVYYSLSGFPGEWILIPELSSYTVNDTTVAESVTITPPFPWFIGQKLYILWADDNGPGGTSDPMEGANTIDNFSVAFSMTPPSIDTQPQGQTNAEYSVVTLNVVASGTGPFVYQWTKNGNPVGGNTPTLILTNTVGTGFAWSRPEDSGDYAVTVSGAQNPPATSAAAHVVITPDTNAPSLVWAIVDTNTVRVLFSEPLINPLTDYADFLAANLNWTIDPISGPGGSLGSPDVDMQLVGNELRLVYSVLPFDPNTTYAVNFNGNTLFDRAQTANGASTLSVPLARHELVVVTLNQLWRYSDKDLAPPANWFMPNFDDSDTSFWSEGPGVFDGKREATQPWCRATSDYTLGNVGTCLVLSNANASGDVPAYYFRTHFAFNGSPNNVALRLFGKFDDGGIVYLNGVEIGRIGVAAGAHPHAFISGVRTVGDSDAPDSVIIAPGSALVSGDNVLAVELRQVNATSSDITMGLQITADAPAPLTGTPPSIEVEPVGATNQEYSVVTLSVVASGTPPLTYQWKKNGVDVGANSSTLTITNTTGSGFTWSRPEDSGDYSVVVTGQTSPAATSQTVHVDILPDTTTPRAVWAIVDTNTVRVLLSEPLANPASDYADFLAANLNWSIDPVSGPGASLGSPDVDMYLTNNEIYLVYSALPLDPNTVYAVHFLGNTLFDLSQAGNGTNALTVPLSFHEQVVVAMDKLWKYSDKDIAAPPTWFLPNFDDSDTSFWSEGPGVFDAKREATQPWCRATPVNSITNSVGTCLVLSNANATGDTPTYYFRTHFNFSAAVPSNTVLRLYGIFDDAAVVYLNGVELERVGVPEGPHPHNFFGGLRSVGDTEAPDTAVLLPGSLLVNGDNVLAVELRQVNATSSDITMALQVIAATATPGAQLPRLTIAPASGGQISVGWTPSGGSLLEATSVTGPWSTNSTASNPYLFTPAPGAGQKFFRVAQ